MHYKGDMIHGFHVIMGRRLRWVACSQGLNTNLTNMMRHPLFSVTIGKSMKFLHAISSGHVTVGTRDWSKA
jgi:hypothetical protein